MKPCLTIQKVYEIFTLNENFPVHVLDSDQHNKCLEGTLHNFTNPLYVL
jgi:hypothetical protein